MVGFVHQFLQPMNATLNADRVSTEFTASSLQKCSENSKFKRELVLYSKDIARFDRYSKALCGDDGLPHLIVGHLLTIWGFIRRGHERSSYTVSYLFTGIIGWSGREFNRVKKDQKPADMEIIIDLELARKCLVKGAQWPFLQIKAEMESRGV